MIIPLFLEQLLVMLVGIADTLVISYAGDAAVSGVSLVNQFNNIFILLFSAMASGGAVVISQYLGREEKKNASKTASQLLLCTTLFSAAVVILVLAFRSQMLGMLFGRVEADVMTNCLIYLEISAYSYPFIAIYNAGVAVFRSGGNTTTPMVVSMAANVINVIGNLIGVFVLHVGTAGVAWPSFLARAFSAILITFLVFRHKAAADFLPASLVKFEPTRIRQILHIAIPNGLEDGIFQLVKVALSSMVALFGTLQIAANGIAQSFWSLAAIAGVSMGPVFITVIGQCMGEHNVEEARFYFKKLLKMTLVISVAWNALILMASPLFLNFYQMSEQERQLVFQLIVIHNVFNALAYPFSGALSAGLRAAGDVRFTMIVSISSTLFVRVLFSWILGVVCQMGVIGIALAMAMDWIVRAVIFYQRERSGKWESFQVI